MNASVRRSLAHVNLLLATSVLGASAHEGQDPLKAAVMPTYQAVKNALKGSALKALIPQRETATLPREDFHAVDMP